MRVEQLRYASMPATRSALDSLFVDLGFQGSADGVFVAQLQDRGEPGVSAGPVDGGPPSGGSQGDGPRSSVAEPVPLGKASGDANSMPTFAPQIATFAPRYDPTVPNSVLKQMGTPVGVATVLDQSALHDPVVLAQRTRDLLRRIGADPKTLEYTGDLAASAGEIIKGHFPDATSYVDAPVAGIALINAGVGLTCAHRRADRREMTHYILDGTEHALDLGGDLTDLCTELLTHAASGTGSTSLHGVALAVRVFKTLYLLSSPKD